MDALHQLELDLLYMLALLIGTLVLWLLKRAIAFFGIQLTADRNKLLESTVNKGMTWAVTAADDVIREKGWDHIDSKNVVINTALPAIQERFAETMTKLGVDLSNPEDREKLAEMMERMWPDVASRLSASPTTPPAPVISAVVAAVPAP